MLALVTVSAFVTVLSLVTVLEVVLVSAGVSASAVLVAIGAAALETGTAVTIVVKIPSTVDTKVVEVNSCVVT